MASYLNILMLLALALQVATTAVAQEYALSVDANVDVGAANLNVNVSLECGNNAIGSAVTSGGGGAEIRANVTSDVADVLLGLVESRCVARANLTPPVVAPVQFVNLVSDPLHHILNVSLIAGGPWRTNQ